MLYEHLAVASGIVCIQAAAESLGNDTWRNSINWLVVVRSCDGVFWFASHAYASSALQIPPPATCPPVMC